jgi:hypothetical protein
MAWTITWRPGTRERFEGLLGEIGPTASKCVLEKLQGLPIGLPDQGPQFLFVTVNGITLECGVDPVTQMADVQGVVLDVQS